MNHSDQLDALAAALSAAQGAFESVGKDSTNPFFKSKYAGLPAVVKAATPILVANGLSVTQTLGHDEAGDTLTTMVLHSSGQWIADTMHLRPVKDDPQAQGSATTYGRRYAYMAALGLVADEDDDGNAGSTGSRPASRQKRTTSGGAVKPTAPEPTSKGKADRADPSPATVAVSVDKIRTVFSRSGWDADKLKWGLVEVGADVAPLEDAATPEAFATVLGSLSLDQATLLVESMGGSAGDLA